MNKFIKTLGWMFAVVFVFLIFICRAGHIKSKYKKYLTDPTAMPIEIRYRAVYKLAKNVLFIKRYKVISQGAVRLPNIPALYVANHKSNIDPIVLFKVLYENAKIPYFRFVAKYELSDNSYIAAALKLVDTIFIDRKNFHKTLTIFKDEINFKEDKRTIIIFPEGTRIYNPNEIASFHAGSFRIAYDSLIPIVPIAIAGAIDTDKTKHEGNYKNKAGIIYLHFLKQLRPQEYANTNINYTAVEIHHRILKEYMRIFNLIKDNKPNQNVFNEKDNFSKESRN